MGISKPIHVKSVVGDLLNSHDGKCMSIMVYYLRTYTMASMFNTPYPDLFLRGFSMLIYSGMSKPIHAKSSFVNF